MLWHCRACTCAYSVGAPRCPQCDTEHEETAVPKIHADRPPTYEADIPAPGQAGEQPPAPRKRTRKGAHTRAQAGTASGAGAASS